MSVVLFKLLSHPIEAFIFLEFPSNAATLHHENNDQIPGSLAPSSCILNAELHDLQEDLMYKDVRLKEQSEEITEVKISYIYVYVCVYFFYRLYRLVVPSSLLVVLWFCSGLYLKFSTLRCIIS